MNRNLTEGPILKNLMLFALPMMAGNLLQQIYTYRKTLWLSYKKIILLIMSIFVLSGPAADMAVAMVVVRGERSSMSFGELLERSVEVFNDKSQLKAYRMLMEDENQSAVGSEWQESYVSSPFLDRLCNYRVADATIYHAQKAGFGNKEMLDLFLARIATMFPGPISNFFFPDIDKSELNYSTMDKLYFLSARGGIGGYKVGGDVGLGLATFGYLYFPLCLLLYLLVFYIMDGFVCIFHKKLFFPVFTLISIYFTYFLMFQVANGLIAQTTFVLWSFWWNAIWYGVVYKIVRSIL